MATKRRKALIIGLDCATRQFVFDARDSALPNMTRLRENGCWGLLESCIPAVTCPAWACMATSRDPGQLGIYGFRNRADYSYDALVIPDSGAVTSPTVWDVLSQHGCKSVVHGVPLTYPPKPLSGWLVCGFLTPGTEADYTYPRDLRETIAQEAPKYAIDVADFRTEDKEGLLDRIYRITRYHFSVLEHLLHTTEWDMAWSVEMGVDRIQHAFWRYAAPDHRLYEPGNPHERAIQRYYQYIDGCIGRLLALVPEDTLVLVVSDHGARTLEGAVCINEWLMREGLLVLKHTPEEPTGLNREWIDWARTRVWAEGGYFARVFVNLGGREPLGTVQPSECESLLRELTGKLSAMTDHRGRPMGNRVFRPADIYREVRGIPPDLMVYFGDLAWRAAGKVGHGEVFIFGNDTGPDDANHAQHGVFILSDSHDGVRGEVRGARIYDIAPTILERMGVPVPSEMIGAPLPAIPRAWQRMPSGGSRVA